MIKIVLGLSGGVDSAVAARLLIREGFRVSGLYLDIGLPGGAEGAREVSEFLKIPLGVRDIRGEMEKKVCTPFVEGYLRGETPNPCIACNPEVKLNALAQYADEIGAEYISTGHYARVSWSYSPPRLQKGRPANDQSYMLCRVTMEQLRRLVLPLGAYEKAEVRKMARELGLPVADKPDSMEICFIPDGDWAGYIERRGTVPPEGNFVDEDGKILGRHRGMHRYTVGQSSGLGIALGRRMYVVELRPGTGEVVLSGSKGPFLKRIRAEDVNWLVAPPEKPFEAHVRIRHSRSSLKAVIEPRGDKMEIEFDEPARAPTPGQYAAAYDGVTLLGAGRIVR